MGELPVWLANSFSKLSALKQKDSLPHGLLLVGHQGDGSSVFSKELVKLLLCLDPNEFACGVCKACVLAHNGHHPDLTHIEPEGKSMTIKVDAIRQVTKKVSETAQQGGNKVIYIESAQKMNTNAANALLKVLEEPTKNTYILLETDQLGQTLPTVRSRCRIIQLGRPNLEQSLSYLSAKGMAVDTITALGIANQRPFDALNLPQAAIDSWFEVEDNFLKNQSFTSLSQFVAKVDINTLLAQMLTWLDSALREKQNLKIELAPISDGLLQSLVLIDAISLYRFRDYIIEKIASLKRQSNLNVQLLAEELTSRWLDLRGSK